jgi:hypothetical protein
MLNPFNDNKNILDSGMGTINKIFGYVGLALAVAAIAIATGVGAVAGAKTATAFSSSAEAAAAAGATSDAIAGAQLMGGIAAMKGVVVGIVPPLYDGLDMVAESQREDENGGEGGG